jgi:hypothetical protein
MATKKKRNALHQLKTVYIKNGFSLIRPLNGGNRHVSCIRCERTNQDTKPATLIQLINSLTLLAKALRPLCYAALALWNYQEFAGQEFAGLLQLLHII